MQKRVIVDKIFIRKEPFYESPLFESYFSFGDIIYSNKLICKDGDFKYLEIEYKNNKGFIPREYLMDEKTFSYLTNISPSKLIQVPPSYTNCNKVYILNTVYKYLDRLLNKAKEDKISLIVLRAYQSIEDLSKIYSYEYEKIFMQNIIEKPHNSIYYSGRLIDVSSSEINYEIHPIFYETNTYKWLAQNAHKYNFKLTSPEYFLHKKSNWKPWQLHFNKNEKVNCDLYSKKDRKELNSKLYSFSKSLIICKYINKTNDYLKYIFVHDNEHTARKTAKYAVNFYGGTLYQIVNGYKRNILINIENEKVYYDPNRIFTKKGLKENLIALNEGITEHHINRAIAKITSISMGIIKLICLRKEFFFIALHTNNRNSSLSVNYFAVTHLHKSFKIHINKKHNPKNFFYTIYKEDFIYLSLKNYNVVLQKENVLCDDGSMSILMSKNSINYITIEVQEGYFTFQKEMLSILINHFKTKKEKNSLLR